MSALWQRERFTVLLVTHDVEEALVMAERVIVLSDRPARIKSDVEVGIAVFRAAGQADAIKHAFNAADAIDRSLLRSPASVQAVTCARIHDGRVNAGNSVRCGRRFGQGFSSFAAVGNGNFSIFESVL